MGIKMLGIPVLGEQTLKYGINHIMMESHSIVRSSIKWMMDHGIRSISWLMGSKVTCQSNSSPELFITYVAHKRRVSWSSILSRRFAVFSQAFSSLVLSNSRYGMSCTRAWWIGHKSSLLPIASTINNVFIDVCLSVRLFVGLTARTQKLLTFVHYFFCIHLLGLDFKLINFETN